MTPAALRLAIGRLTEDDADAILNDWRFWARPDQVAPTDRDWQFWLYMAGRGAGKTRSGAEWVRECVMGGASRIALVAPTNYDARHTMVEGVSGIMATCWDGDRDWRGRLIGRPKFQAGLKRVVWSNGAVATLFSAEEPDRLRGPQHEKAWADELAAWKNPDATWDQLMFGLRLGRKPQAMVTTTPKPLPILRELLRDPRTVLTKAATRDNERNLAPAFLQKIVAKYAGTRLGRQELEAELIDEVEGALWQRAWFDRPGFYKEAPDLRKVVVAVDPPATDGATSALCGIVIAGEGADGHAYILEDRSARMSPAQWGKAVVDAYEEFAGDCIVAEINQGGAMVKHTIRTALPSANVVTVRAYRGKFIRAEPVSALYEQGRVHHCQPFPEMEDQMTTWVPDGESASPDRLDAAVYAVQKLMLGGHNVGFYIGN